MLKDEVMKTLNIDEETFNKCQKKLDEINGWYFWNPQRGGLSMIITENGEKLVANSSISFKRQYHDFIKGKK